MTKTTSEVAHPSPNFRATPARGCLATGYDLECSGHSMGPSYPQAETLPLGHRGPQMESGFELVTLWLQGRDLTTRPLRPHQSSERKLHYFKFLAVIAWKSAVLAQVLFSSSNYGSKLPGLFENNHRIASKDNINLTKLRLDSSEVRHFALV
ncbi:hypothetical protein AVEN_186273-1 [Araneus ventricosus]|uniref:Uncharacterized protein n=1 Tax=Araneus ventricosus TaxID=182803 RepID=A0A4Y2UQ59_ARAVE|nr:hypothetical protein AVEN_186273-1 [Araneus ventricosus]